MLNRNKPLQIMFFIISRLKGTECKNRYWEKPAVCDERQAVPLNQYD
jgi:hypothetical protein